MTKANSSSLKSVVERLDHSEERFRLLVESVQDYALFMLDPAGRVASWNQGAERIKGYGPEEIVGRHFSQFYTREDIERGKPDAALEKAAASGRFADEGWRVRKDGSLYWAGVVITAIRDAGGNLRGFGKVTRDLTERRQATQRLKESEARFRAFMNHSPLPMFVKNLDGRYQYANANFCRMLGLEQARLLGRSDAELFGSGAAASQRAGVATAGEVPDAEEIAEWRIGERVGTLHEFSIRDDEARIVAVGGIVTDLGAQRRADAPAEVEREDRAQINRDVDALANMIARDLRPPLRNIENLAARVREDMAEVNALARRLDTIAHATVKLTKLTNDLLLYSRSGRLNRAQHRSADLNAIVADARKALGASASSRRVRWNVAKLPKVAGDPALLRVVFEQLLSNALKFSQQRDPAEIAVSAGAADGNEVAIEIRDNGVGFAEQHAHKLFAAFQRLHDGDEFEGAGLGLITTKRIVECHGGRVWAKSRAGEGASFFFTLRPAANGAPRKT